MREGIRTAILLCGDLESASALREWSPDDLAAVHVVPGLCRRMDAIPAIAQDASCERLVIGLCREDHSPAELQSQVRKAGLDALGVEVLSLRGCRPKRARILLAAAVARARAFTGSRPENVKLYLSSKISRRALFKLSLTEYRAAPSIDHGKCASDIGCRVCAELCPQGALKWSDGVMDYNKDICEPCGICVTACPRGAVINPACTPAQMEAQTQALLSEPYEGPRGILFICQRTQAPDIDEGWMPVKLPCVGMVTPIWLLAPLLMGAGSVGVLTCGEMCPARQGQVVREKVEYCRELLRSLGAPDDLVVLDPEGAPRHGRPAIIRRNPFTHDARADVILTLAESLGGGSFALEHPLSPLGLVEIQQDVCTACGMCARSCPTGALALEEDDDGVSLSFEAASCVACAQCLPRCPEGERNAISLRRAVDTRAVAGGRLLLRQEKTLRCASCGSQIAPVGMMRRLEEILGDEYAQVMPLLRRYCVDCRVMVGGTVSPR